MASPGGAEAAGPRRTRSPVALAALGFVLIGVVGGLLALGTWQVHRLAWKRDLIARVDARVHAAPTAPPGPDLWPSVTAGADEYRHVRVAGTFLNDRETFVQALTERGGGFWVLTPFRTETGPIVEINRGFVPPERRDPAKRSAGQIAGTTMVTGLLRMTEPNGSFLRSNDPAGGRWYSRDVAAMTAARGLSDVAPYFIDADATPMPGGYPVGGLTVIAFPNNHLVYAFTWYTLGAMLAGAAIWAARDEWRHRRSTQLDAPKGGSTRAAVGEP